MKLNYLLIFFVPIVLLLLGFRLLVFDLGFYQKEFVKHGVYANLEKSLADENAKLLIGYLKGKNTLENSFFNEKEKTHMRDVKSIVDKVIVIFYISLIFVVSSITWLFYKRNYKVLLNSLFYSSIIAILLIVALSLVFLLDFSSFFLNFHLLSFDNDLWLLNPETDNLIVMFQEQFFYDIGLRMMIISFFSSILLFFSSFFIKKTINIRT